MVDEHRGGRLEDASELVKEIAALSKVKPEYRAGLIHDRLVSAIDDICVKRKGDGQAVFTSKQISVIKDVAFQIVYILDKRNHPSGVFSRSAASFKDASLTTQIGIVGGILGIIASLYAGYKFAQPMLPSVTISWEAQADSAPAQAPLVDGNKPAPTTAP